MDPLQSPFIRTTRPSAAVRDGRRDWFKIRNLAGGEAEILIYDEIGYFGITAKDFRDELAAISAADKIALHVNSPGGDVFDAIAIYNMLRDHPAEITTYVDSLAASAASFIALAGDKVVMAKHAQMMIHDAWGIAIGNAEDMQKAAAFLETQSDVIASIYADRAGKTKAYWRGLMAAETWFTDQQAVDAGLATVVGSHAAAKNSFDLSIFRNPPQRADAKAIAPSTTATSDAAWDGPAVEASIPNDITGPDLRKFYAWVDPEANPDTKAAYKFIHHEANADGMAAAANLRACSGAIAVLNGARGGANIPDADRQGVWDHLAQHLRDGGQEPPPLNTLSRPASAKGQQDDDQPALPDWQLEARFAIAAASLEV